MTDHIDAAVLLWHYTVSGRLQRILADGVLKRSTTGLRKGERAGVWFTSRSTWEPTATPWRRGADGQFRAASMDTLAAAGLARIGVAPDLVRTTWAQHRRFGGACRGPMARLSSAMPDSRPPIPSSGAPATAMYRGRTGYASRSPPMA